MTRALTRLMVMVVGGVLLLGLTPDVASAQSRDCSFRIRASLQGNAEYAPIVIRTSSRWRKQTAGAWHKLKSAVTVRAGRTATSSLIQFNAIGIGNCPNNMVFDLDVGCPAYATRRARNVSWMLVLKRKDADNLRNYPVFDLENILNRCRETN